MKAFALWLQGVWDQVVVGVRMALGDTRPKEVREAPIGYMGQNKAPNPHHHTHNRVVMTNEYYKHPQETVVISQPSMAKEYTFGSVTPIRDARKPVLDRTDMHARTYFAELVALGLFDPRCNLNGVTLSWGFQVLYDKKELRMFQYPVVNGSPTVILSAEGMSRKVDTDLPSEVIYDLLIDLVKHVRKQNLNNKETP